MVASAGKGRQSSQIHTQPPNHHWSLLWAVCYKLFFGPAASEAHSTGVHGLVVMSHTVRLLPVCRSYQPLYIPILRHAGVSGPLVDHPKPWGMRNTGSSSTIYLGHTNVAALLSRAPLDAAFRATLEAEDNLLVGWGGEALKFLASPQLSGCSKAPSVHTSLVLRQAGKPEPCVWPSGSCLTLLFLL